MRTERRSARFLIIRTSSERKRTERRFCSFLRNVVPTSELVAKGNVNVENCLVIEILESLDGLIVGYTDADRFVYKWRFDDIRGYNDRIFGKESVDYLFSYFEDRVGLVLKSSYDDTDKSEQAEDGQVKDTDSKLHHVICSRDITILSKLDELRVPLQRLFHLPGGNLREFFLRIGLSNAGRF